MDSFIPPPAATLAIGHNRNTLLFCKGLIDGFPSMAIFTRQTNDPYLPPYTGGRERALPPNLPPYLMLRRSKIFDAHIQNIFTNLFSLPECETSC